MRRLPGSGSKGLDGAAGAAGASGRVVVPVVLDGDPGYTQVNLDEVLASVWFVGDVSWLDGCVVECGWGVYLCTGLQDYSALAMMRLAVRPGDVAAGVGLTAVNAGTFALVSGPSGAKTVGALEAFVQPAVGASVGPVVVYSLTSIDDLVGALVSVPGSRGGDYLVTAANHPDIVLKRVSGRGLNQGMFLSEGSRLELVGWQGPSGASTDVVLTGTVPSSNGGTPVSLGVVTCSAPGVLRVFDYFLEVWGIGGGYDGKTCGRRGCVHVRRKTDGTYTTTSGGFWTGATFDDNYGYLPTLTTTVEAGGVRMSVSNIPTDGSSTAKVRLTLRSVGEFSKT